MLAMCLGFALTHTRGTTSTRGEAEEVWQAEAPAWDLALAPNLARLAPQLRVTRPEDDFDFVLDAFLAAVRAQALR